MKKIRLRYCLMVASFLPLALTSLIIMTSCSANQISQFPKAIEIYDLKNSKKLGYVNPQKSILDQTMYYDPNKNQFQSNSSSSESQDVIPFDFHQPLITIWDVFIPFVNLLGINAQTKQDDITGGIIGQTNPDSLQTQLDNEIFSYFLSNSYISGAGTYVDESLRYKLYLSKISFNHDNDFVRPTSVEKSTTVNLSNIIFEFSFRNPNNDDLFATEINTEPVAKVNNKEYPFEKNATFTVQFNANAKWTMTMKKPEESSTRDESKPSYNTEVIWTFPNATGELLTGEIKNSDLVKKWEVIKDYNSSNWELDKLNSVANKFKGIINNITNSKHYSNE